MQKVDKIRFTKEEWDLIMQMNGFVAMLNDEFPALDLKFGSYYDEDESLFVLLSKANIEYEKEK